MEYVLLRTYDDYISAHIAMGQLVEENISCWLKDENTVTVDPAITYAVGGIKLMVADVQAERAGDILRVSENKLKGLGFCPRCGSMNYETKTVSPGMLDLFLDFFGRKKVSHSVISFHCCDCGHIFDTPVSREPELKRSE